MGTRLLVLVRPELELCLRTHPVAPHRACAGEFASDAAAKDAMSYD